MGVASPFDRSSLSLDNPHMLGHKVMRFKKGRAVSMADSRQGFRPTPGMVVRLKGDGMWLSRSCQYVLDHYAVNDVNVLLTFDFDPSDVTVGNLTDRETEFAVTEATLLASTVFADED